MEPIATKMNLVVDEESSLEPSAGSQAIGLLRDLSVSDPSSSIVLCTHGEVIGAVLALLAREDGVRLSRRPPGLKGCVWVLEVHKGKVTTAKYITPGR